MYPSGISQQVANGSTLAPGMIPNGRHPSPTSLSLEATPALGHNRLAVPGPGRYNPPDRNMSIPISHSSSFYGSEHNVMDLHQTRPVRCIKPFAINTYFIQDSVHDEFSQIACRSHKLQSNQPNYVASVGKGGEIGIMNGDLGRHASDLSTLMHQSTSGSQGFSNGAVMGGIDPRVPHGPTNDPVHRRPSYV